MKGRIWVNGGRESESGVRFGVTPFFDVPKIEHYRFSAFPINKKLVLTSFRVMKDGES